MVPGFHCSSLEYHAAATLIPELAKIGFGAAAIRPRRGGWDGDAAWFQAASAEISAAAKEHQVDLVIDLDAPFYDDPSSPDPFSLASDDPAMRQQAATRMERWIDRSADLSPVAITFSVGRVSDSVSSPFYGPVGEEVLERLAASIEPLAERADKMKIRLALRPVAEHAIATVAQFERFGQWVGRDTSLGLAADVGEMLLGGEFPIGARLARLQRSLTCVYLCEPDLERGCDQRFGRGDIDLGRVWSVMTESGFEGAGLFRACGHGRMGLDLARKAYSMTGLSP